MSQCKTCLGKLNSRGISWKSFLITPKSWATTAKISWINPWVSRIDWWKGHWWGSTYMSVRLSDIRQQAKQAKYAFLGHFWTHVGQSYSHIGCAKPMPFASINSTNPRTNPWNFGGNCSAFGGGWKTQFFWVGHFEFFLAKKIFFLLNSYQN